MKKRLLGVLILLIFLFGCKKNKSESPIIDEPFIKEKITGQSQKGPFINGSSLTIFELDTQLVQTGKSFQTQIKDNLGSFELNNISLLSHYGKLKADGFYFNEIRNANSISPISLYALSDLSYKTKVNVNLLSTLEVGRVEQLVSNGVEFSAAKHQAQQEILSLFFIQEPSMPESELLDISVNGNENAILLATSLVLQGYRTEAGLSQLLADISSDIKPDGILNNSALGSALLNDAKFLNLAQIRTNLETKYAALGVTTIIPHFEVYINQFLDSANYTFTAPITYPTNGIYGVNILNTSDSIFSSSAISGNSFCAFIPGGQHLKIRYDEGTLAYDQGSLNGWIDKSPPFRTFESTRDGLIELKIFTSFQGISTLYFYDNYSPTPTRIKKLYVQ